MNLIYASFKISFSLFLINIIKQITVIHTTVCINVIKKLIGVMSESAVVSK
jgi:hypothetical protein